MKRVLFLSKSESSASTRYRAFDYFPFLQANEWSASHMGLHGGLSSKFQILSAARQADVVVVLRHGVPIPFVWLLRAFSKKLVFDFDDAIFLRSSGRRSPVREMRFARIVSLCDEVWAGNQYLADRAREINKNVHLFPTAVKISRYCIGTDKPGDVIDLVWIGSQSTGKYLANVLPLLEEAARKEPRLRLKVIADFALASDVLRIINVPWSMETEVAELSSSHIGIAPMPDTPWTRGKCALKVLQYMACRLPVISSDAGANREVIVDGATGFLVSSAESWLDAILKLSRSEALRASMGHAGREICEQRYSLESCSEMLLSRLEGLSCTASTRSGGVR